MNSSVNDVMFCDCRHNTVLIFIRYYLTRFVIVIGIFLNAICVLVYTKILMINDSRVSGNMYKYLLIKSINDTLFFICHISEVFIYCEGCGNVQTLFILTWKVWIYEYLKNITILMSCFCEMIITLECYVFIKKGFKFIFKNSFFIVIILVFLIFSSTFSSYILRVDIKPINNLTNETYEVVPTLFYEEWSETFEMIEIIIADYTPLMVLLLINILIKISMKNVSRKNSITERRFQVEQTKAKFIIFTSINFIIGHTPIAIYNSPIPNQSFSCFWTCYVYVAWFIFLIFLSTPFYVYYSFSLKFRNALNSLI
jgi:hypothetical protein